MSLGHGASIVRDGIILHYDPINSKDTLAPNNIKNLAGNNYDAFRQYASGTTTVDGVTYNRTDLCYIDSDGVIVFDPKPPAVDSSEYYSEGGNWFEVDYDISWRTNDFTWIVWVYFKEFSYFVLDWRADSGRRSSLQVFNGTPSISYRMFESPFTTYTVTSDKTFYQENEWCYVCVKRSSGSVSFHNGIDKSSEQEFAYDYIEGRNLGIGWGPDIDRQWRTINGKIGTIQIYDRALTDLEIRQNFEALRGRYGI